MKYNELISRSKFILLENVDSSNNFSLRNIFSYGAKWMYDELNKLENKNIAFNFSTNYTLYGILKYSICAVAMIFSSILFFKINPILVPFSILIFYFFEVHFLFLFPILIDNIKNPIRTSIRQTYKIGVLKLAWIVIPIACFMIAGLFSLKNPFRNWYIGCLAILLYYQDEVRNRI